MNKYEKLSEWLSRYEPIGSWLYFNVTNVEADNTSLNSVSNDRSLNKFIDGSTECELLFAIDLVKQYDTGTSELNLEAMAECEALIDWCEHQLELPKFDNCVVYQLEILNNVPSLSVDTDESLAKYQIQGKVSYLEMKGVN